MSSQKYPKFLHTPKTIHFFWPPPPQKKKKKKKKNILNFKILNQKKLSKPYVCMKISEYPPTPLPHNTHTPGRFDQFEYECKVRYTIHHIIG